MLNLIGDMYRKRTVLSPTVTETPVLSTGGTGTDEALVSIDNAYFISYPAGIFESGHAFNRCTLTRTLELESIIHGRISVPEDSEPMPETLNFKFESAGVTTIQNLEELFVENYGDIFSVRSNPEERIWFGVIPSWVVEEGGSCRTNFSFDFLVRDSYTTEEDVGRRIERGYY